MTFGHSARAGVTILRRFFAIGFALLAFCAITASAQQNNLVGQWRGVYQGITLTIVIQANGQYSQLAQFGTLITQQSGPYKLVAPNTISFSVMDWAPKTQQVYHPTGAVGGFYTPEPTSKPPGATDKYVFNGPNTIVLTDELTHGSITLTRVP
jgi:hypothetical protein